MKLQKQDFLTKNLNNSQLCTTTVTNSYDMVMPQTCECATLGSYCVSQFRLKSVVVESQKMSKIL